MKHRVRYPYLASRLSYMYDFLVTVSPRLCRCVGVYEPLVWWRAVSGLVTFGCGGTRRRTDHHWQTRDTARPAGRRRRRRREGRVLRRRPRRVGVRPRPPRTRTSCKQTRLAHQSPAGPIVTKPS